MDDHADHDDDLGLEIADSTPAPAFAEDADDEAAELAAADAEIDAEDDVDLADEDELEIDVAGDEDEATDEDERDAGPADEAPAAAPAIELTPQVYARIHGCLQTQLAGIEAQIARAERVAESDPFFDRWKVVLVAQRDRLRRQIDEVRAKAPAEPLASEAVANGAVAEPESLSA